MSGKLLEKYAGRSATSEDGKGIAEDAAEDLGAFGIVRGLHQRSLMIELRRKGGNILAIGYGFIDRVAFDPSEGITLHCGARSIAIKGRNLNCEVRPHVTLFQGLTRARVSWIAEASQAEVLQSGKNALIVEAIEW